MVLNTIDTVSSVMELRFYINKPRKRGKKANKKLLQNKKSSITEINKTTARTKTLFKTNTQQDEKRLKEKVGEDLPKEMSFKQIIKKS